MCVYDCVSKNALCMGVYLCVVCVVYEHVECKCVHVSVVRMCEVGCVYASMVCECKCAFG